MESQTTTEIICILDKSGSMQALRQETIEGLQQFINEQKKEIGLCNLTLVQFNHEVALNWDRIPIASIPDLTEEDYEPKGYTALLDAIGLTLKTAMGKQFLLPTTQQPEKVIVFIITDGMENASCKYSKDQVKEMIETLTTNKGWEFQFYGANVDAFSEARNLGISGGYTDTWNHSKEGLKSMMDGMSKKSLETRRRKM